MSQTPLVAQTGRPTGSRNSRRLRAEGQIPGTVYGGDKEAVSVVVERAALRQALSGPGGTNTFLDLQIDGGHQMAIVKDMQRHPVRRNVTHIDFLRVTADQEVEVDVVIELVGEAKAVVSNGGLVDKAIDTLTVKARPDSIPTSITVDITDMQPGDVIHLGDITLPAGTTTDAEPDLAVVITIATASAAPTQGEPETT